MSESQKILSIGAAILLLAGTTGCGNGENVLTGPDILGQDITLLRYISSVSTPEDEFIIHYEDDVILPAENKFLFGGQSTQEDEVFSIFREKEQAGNAGGFFFYHEDGEDVTTEDMRQANDNTVQSITPSYGNRIWRKAVQNNDTVGWLHVPGTGIDEVVVQTPSHLTNDYYLNVNFNGRPDKNGTYCVDRRAKFGSGSREELSRITTIYGHSWSDSPSDDLFAQLKNYKDEDFARQHPYIYFSTGAEDMAWEVFAVFDTPTNLLYNVPNLNTNYFFDMLDIIDEASLYNYDIAINAEDKILTLSTCTFSVKGHEALPAINNYRFAIMARLVDPDEAAKEEAIFSINPAPISPDEIKALVSGGAIRDYDYVALIF